MSPTLLIERVPQLGAEATREVELPAVLGDIADLMARETVTKEGTVVAFARNDFEVPAVAVGIQETPDDQPVELGIFAGEKTARNLRLIADAAKTAVLMAGETSGRLKPEDTNIQAHKLPGFSAERDGSFVIEFVVPANGAPRPTGLDEGIPLAKEELARALC